MVSFVATKDKKDMIYYQHIALTWWWHLFKLHSKQ